METTSNTFERYTIGARQFSTRHPLLSSIGIQANFWITANILLGIILHLQSLSINEMLPLHLKDRFTPLSVILTVAVISGTLYGVMLGTIDYNLDKQFFRKKPLGRIILFKAIIASLIIITLFAFTRYVLLDVIVSYASIKALLPYTEKSWLLSLCIILIFYFCMTLLMGFINQVNKKYGPGILIPMLFGRYRTPREEERIFMFRDLKSSTTIAELSGNIQYSALIRDCFLDINQVVSSFNAEVYQYVGDEIVISWSRTAGLRDLACIRFFFSCEDLFRERREFYKSEYNIVPQFKAGLHMGTVVAVEVGEIKRDIAYHGDTLNTAARIQSICNQYGKNLLISEFMLNTTGLKSQLQTEELGMIQLKGKMFPIGICCILGVND